MTPDASEDDLVAQLIAAPPRERRLTAAQRKKQSRRVVLPAPASFSAASVRATAVRPGGNGISVESKLAALHDPADILQLMHTEAALRRAQRLSGGGEQQRHLIRLLSILMLFALAIAAVGAMWWLQTGLTAGHRRPRAFTPASPTPAASASPAVPALRSPAPSR